MCFSSKVKQPKVSDQQPAPQPVLLESPKGAEFGDGADDTVDKAETTSGRGSVTIDKEPSKQTGEGTQTSVVKDTGTVKKPSAAVKRAIKRA